ncbi:hypothetical protein D9M68_912720 [compost metagenome]
MQGAQVAGVLDEHLAVLVDQHLAQQVERLLRARHDQDLVGGDVRAGAVQIVGNPLAQRRVAFGRAVLQRGAAVGGQYLVECLSHHFYREAAGRRQAACERNDFGTLGYLEDLADGGAGELLGAFREGKRRFERLVHGVLLDQEG